MIRDWKFNDSAEITEEKCHNLSMYVLYKKTEQFLIVLTILQKLQNF